MRPLPAESVGGWAGARAGLGGCGGPREAGGGAPAGAWREAAAGARAAGAGAGAGAGGLRVRPPVLSFRDRMRYVASYLLAALGGNASPSAKDIKKILDSVGIEADDDRLNKVAAPLGSGVPAAGLPRGKRSRGGRVRAGSRGGVRPASGRARAPPLRTSLREGA